MKAWHSLIFVLLFSVFLFGCANPEVQDQTDDKIGPVQNNTINKGCEYGNPTCPDDYECIENSCELKQGCDYGNPPCGHDQECIENKCVIKQGCEYNNPPCGEDFDCIDNECSLKAGCGYSNPPCDSGYNCVDNTCVGEPVSVRGRMVDQQGSPIPGVSIGLFHQHESDGKTYRYEIALGSTDSNGDFYFDDQTIESGYSARLGSPGEYHLFVSASKTGYMDIYIYDFGETPKAIGSGEWDMGTITMDDLGSRQTMTDGRFVVKYYANQYGCAVIAMDKMMEFYPQVRAHLGIEPVSNTTTFTYSTRLEQGSGDWIGDLIGIRTVCYPWTDNLDNPQIAAMWEDNIPHELSHHFLIPLAKPYWAEEGLAQYTSKTINGEIDCSGPFVPIVNLVGENMLQYDSAACAFHLLEEQKPGFIKDLVDEIRTNPNQCNSRSGYFIKTTMSDIYGSDLTNHFIDNFGFDASTLDSENNCP